MKPSVVIPPWRILTNWMISAIVGTLLWPPVALIISLAFGNRDAPGEGIAVLFLLVLVVSAACSLPALIVLFFSHVMLNSRGVSLKKHRQIHMTIHLIVSVLTFVVLFLWMGERDDDLNVVYVVLPLTYTAVGLFVEYRTYRRYEKQVSENDISHN